MPATIFPFLEAQARVEGSAGREHSAQEERGDTIELHPIKTPHRQLVQLALHHRANLPARVGYIHDYNYSRLLNAAYASEIPRALVFFDLPGGQPIIPVAAELASGRVVTLWVQRF